MNNDKSIVMYREDYGKIVFYFAEMLERRELTRNQLAVKSGIKYEIISKWCKGDIERMDIDVLTKLCYVLDCQVSDLIEFVKAD